MKHRLLGAESNLGKELRGLFNNLSPPSSSRRRGRIPRTDKAARERGARQVLLGVFPRVGTEVLAKLRGSSRLGGAKAAAIAAAGIGSGMQEGRKMLLSTFLSV